MDQVNNKSENTEGVKSFYNIDKFYEQLKKVRIYRGFNQQSQVARALPISRQVLSLWELGRRLPTTRQLAKLANFFNIESCYFFIPFANPENYDLVKKGLSDNGGIN